MNQYGCLMLSTPIKHKIKIPDKELYMEYNENNLPMYGLETDLHCTVVYGFENTYNDKLIKKLQKITNSFGTINLEITDVSTFSSENYDVLKFDVNSPQLETMNEIITKLFKPVITHPIYHPHITIAYLKKGYADKYCGKFNNSVEIKSNEYVYSNQVYENAKDMWNIK